MALTLAAAETTLVRRRSGALVACGLSATPAADASPRAYLADPLAYGLRQAGYAAADPSAPADADLAAVDADDYDRLLDTAEVRLLETCLANFSQVSYRSGTDGQDLSDYRRDLLAELASKRDLLAKQYGQGVRGARLGLVGLGFAAEPDDDLLDPDDA